MTTPRLLIANPNTSAGITAQMVAVAARLAGGRARVTGATAPFGVAALETPADLAVAKDAVLAMIDACPECDGVLVAAFGDPGLGCARAATSRPVEGLGEAGLLAVADGGRRFGIVTVGPAMEAAITAKVATLGLTGRCAGLEFLSCGVLDLAQAPERQVAGILDRVAWLHRARGAEAVLLAGAPFSGLAGRLAPEAPVPLLDGLGAGVARLLERIGR